MICKAWWLDVMTSCFECMHACCVIQDVSRMAHLLSVIIMHTQAQLTPTGCILTDIRMREYFSSDDER